MIAPDAVADFREEKRFDLLAALVIGVIAVLAAVLAVIQISSGQASERAQLQAARLTVDLSARIEASTTAESSAVTLQQTALALLMQGEGRQFAGVQLKDNGAVVVGKSEKDASLELSTELSATSGSGGVAPLDRYTSDLLQSTTVELLKEVAEQNRQVDLANEASSREQKAILGLSFLALAGVLTGLGAVLRMGRAGWIALIFAAAMTCAAGGLAVLAVI
jgi:hypothetical protein